MKRTWAWFLSAAALTACAGNVTDDLEGENAVAVAAAELQLYKNVALQPLSLNVCFAAPGKLLGPRADNCPINGASQLFKVEALRNALRNSWQLNSMLRFNFVGTCPSAAPTPGTIEVRLFDNYVRTDASGAVIRDPAGNAICDPINDWHQLGGTAGPGGPVHMSICQPGSALCDNEQERLNAILIHEMGHALGFSHEHQRMDAPYLTSYTSQSVFTQVWPQYCAPANPLDHNVTPIDGWEMTAFDPQSIMSYCRDLNLNQTGDGYEAGAFGVDLDRLSSSDRDGIQAAYGFPGTTTTTAVPINCGSGSTMLVGDFTADGISDYLCKSATQISARNGATTATFTLNTNWCSAAGDQLLIGDISGDNRADLLCVTGTALVADFASATFSSLFGSLDVTNPFWFRAPNVKYFIGNFNNSGPLDIARIDLATRAVNVALSNTLTIWGRFYAATTPCLSSTSANLAVADVTGDRIDDIVCVNPTTGSWYTFVTDPFFGSWNFTFPWVAPPWYDRGALIVSPDRRGDFDGDGRQDFLYAHSQGLAIRFGFSLLFPRPEPAWSTTNSDWGGPVGNVFSSTTHQIVTGRVNTDTRDDLIVYKNDYTSFTKIPMPATFHQL